MKQDTRATRNFVSKALYYALRNSEQDFNEAMDRNDDSITDELLQVVNDYYGDYVTKYFNEVDDVIPAELINAFYESPTFSDALIQEISSALYDARQAAREAFLKYFESKADTDDLAADLLNHLSD